MSDISSRVRIEEAETICQRKYLLQSVTLSWRRGNGAWEAQKREVYDKGNGAAILLYNLKRRSVILIRQFRLPTFLNGYRELLVEVPAGGLDGAEPQERIRDEVAEETGYVVGGVKQVFEAFMSPGVFTEKLHFFVAEYDSASRPGIGGGLAEEGEDIEVLEISFAQAFAMIASGNIVDAKTIMLLQHAKINIFAD
ncbi:MULTISPECIES: NUDIX domain-containing protein [unclassified Bradyrhizobium]|uniref:NUDIX domain-containing protein n=1 Tax=unclassified Bradyrhizobium TaxID=2631580 RepID=UPI0028E5EC71|nr:MULTISPECIES: NUDIX domain-containing protein [unclassified Bradyrhizobium]